jgi:hypothetical protein
MFSPHHDEDDQNHRPFVVHQDPHHSHHHHLHVDDDDDDQHQHQQDELNMNMLMVENIMQLLPPGDEDDDDVMEDDEDVLRHLQQQEILLDEASTTTTTTTTQQQQQLQQQQQQQQQQQPVSTTTSTRKRKRKYYSPKKAVSKPFNDWFFELMLFKTRHGHLKIPAGHPLKAWTLFIKDQKKAIDNGEDPTSILQNVKNINDNQLTSERIQVLTQVGFDLNSPREQSWMKSFEELKEYKALHGNCVPTPSTHPKLTKWCNMQRTSKNVADQIKSGAIPSPPHTKYTKVAPLKPERINLLNSIGFPWQLATHPKVGWEARYQQLVQYKEEYGNCNVPQYWKQDEAFGRWVMKQRHEHSLKLRGLKSQLTDEREDRLNALGMNWVAPGFCKSSVPEYVDGGHHHHHHHHDDDEEEVEEPDPVDSFHHHDDDNDDDAEDEEEVEEPDPVYSFHHHDDDAAEEEEEEELVESDPVDSHPIGYCDASGNEFHPV